MVLFSFIAFLVLMTVIGVLSSTKSTKTTTDYILAGRTIGAIPTALSAVSTCHSGFMFIGMIGFTYKYGVSAIWLILSWFIGDLIAWNFIHKPLREKSEQFNVTTIASFVSCHLNKNHQKIIQKIVALFILLFLSVYAAAQLTAGSKALNVLLDWPYLTGIIVGACIVTAYSFSGGVRASIWTDVVQSSIMLFAMLGLFLVALFDVGGFQSLFTQLQNISPPLTQWTPQNLNYGFPLYFASWIAFGFGVMGQPHIMTRPMAISHSNQLKKAKWIYFIWYLVFAFSSLGVGLVSRVLLPHISTLDTELALPILATNLLPSVFVGIILAGIFSATISTADSLILTCSSAVTQDIFSKWKNNFNLSKLTTFLTMLGVVFIALVGSQSVYTLVVLAWSSLSVILGPLILCQCFNLNLSYKASLLCMSLSLITILLWVHVFQLSQHINEVLPGFIIASIVIGYTIIKKTKLKPSLINAKDTTN